MPANGIGEKTSKEIIDYLSSINEPQAISYFTERKLRPLTLIKSDEEKIEKFHEMKERVILK